VSIASITWTVHTSVFDGPLDLLLYLVKRDGVDLRRVSVSEIADSYLSYIDRMRELNLSVASDYLVMAATLCHLKSLEIFPRPPTLLEEEEDPKEQLAQRLEEYQRVRQAAEHLAERDWVDREVFVRKPIPIGALERPLIPGVNAFALLDAYYGLLTRSEAPPAVHEIHRPDLELDVCCRNVLEALGGEGGRSTLEALLRTLLTRAERILTFIATLEMIRLRWIEVRQRGHLAAVHLVSRVPVDMDLTPITGHVEPNFDEV
jgi:segregation and condensation protein A